MSGATPASQSSELAVLASTLGNANFDAAKLGIEVAIDVINKKAPGDAAKNIR